MTRTPIAPTTRLLTLMALFLAVGVLSLRAGDLFTAAPETVHAGTAKERSLTRLLEPVLGEGKVRVAIHGTGEQSILVLHDAPRLPTPDSTPLSEDIRTILSASGGFVEGRDQLTIKPMPFVTAKARPLGPLQLAELMALGLLCAALLASLVMPRERARAARTLAEEPDDTRPARQPVATRRAEAMPLSDIPAPVREAGHVAANDPDGTARLIRKWMGPGQGGQA